MLKEFIKGNEVGLTVRDCFELVMIIVDGLARLGGFLCGGGRDELGRVWVGGLQVGTFGVCIFLLGRIGLWRSFRLLCLWWVLLYSVYW